MHIAKPKFSFNFKHLLIPFFILLVILFLLSTASRFMYFLRTVEQQEVGVQFQGGRIVDIVGPGVYSDIGLFVDLKKISTQAISFVVEDDEIITMDKQRIGIVVSGDIFRPDITKKDIILEKWDRYRGIYLDDVLATSRIEEFTKQAMKVCVGDRTFNDSIIGTSRDDLRACIDDELNSLVSPMGVEVKNLVVPDVIISPEVQAALDAIVKSRLLTEKAAQDQLKAKAEAAAEQARQEGQVRVEQSKIQEQTKQQTLLAQLEQERLLAQKAVIEAERANDLAKLETERQTIAAQKANQLLAAQRDLEINTALAKAASQKAKAEIALETVLAELLTSNPQYLQWRTIQQNAEALAKTDKVIFTPEGTTPTIVMPGPGIVPTANTTP
jgi:hypothetical protein